MTDQVPSPEPTAASSIRETLRPRARSLGAVVGQFALIYLTLTVTLAVGLSAFWQLVFGGPLFADPLSTFGMCLLLFGFWAFLPTIAFTVLYGWYTTVALSSITNRLGERRVVVATAVFALTFVAIVLSIGITEVFHTLVQSRPNRTPLGAFTDTMSITAMSAWVPAATFTSYYFGTRGGSDE